MSERLKERAIRRVREDLERTMINAEREARIQAKNNTGGGFLAAMQRRAEELEWILRACEATPEEQTE